MKKNKVITIIPRKGEQQCKYCPFVNMADRTLEACISAFNIMTGQICTKYHITKGAAS